MSTSALPSPPGAVTFDCWSTLIRDISWDDTVGVRCDRLIKIAAGRGYELDPEKAMELIEGSWQEHLAHWRNGKLFGPAGAARWVLARLDLESTGGVTEGIDDELAAQVTEALADATAEVGTQVVEGAVEAIASLRDAGIPTALICDTGFTPGRHVRRFLDEHGIVLDHYFFSDEVGAPKPSPVIFKAALDALECPAHKSIHIGDLKRTDVAGARAVGMATIRFVGVHDDGWNAEEAAGAEADAVLGRWSDLASTIGI